MALVVVVVFVFIVSLFLFYGLFFNEFKRKLWKEKTLFTKVFTFVFQCIIL